LNPILFSLSWEKIISKIHKEVMGGIILKLLLDVICYLLTADETFGIAQMYLRELWSASGS